MSKEFPQFGEDEAIKPEASAKPRRTGAGKGKKAGAKPKKSGEAEPEEPVEVKAPDAEVALTENPMAATSETDWAEVPAESVGGASPTTEGGGNKRKRRRRKGKGGGTPAPVELPEVPGAAVAASVPQPAKSRINPEVLAESAWKIYLAEVSEEGVALVGDQDARDLARRCFRLAEIFLEEQGRRVGGV